MATVQNKLEICFLSNGSMNISKSIFLTAHNKSYLINCGEGIQKLFHENRKNINSISNIFLTSKSANNISGLLGVGLGLVGCNSQNLSIHGIEEGHQIMLLSKTLLNENTCKITFNKESTFKDDLIKVDKFSYGTSDSESDRCIGYLFSSPKMRQKLNTEKCIELGVPPKILKSSKMAEFFKQQSVIIDENLTIISKDVLIEPPIPERFLVMECPSTDHIPQILDALPYEKFNNDDGVVRLVAHLTEQVVFDSVAYKSMIKRINSYFTGTNAPVHVVVDSNCPIPQGYAGYYVQTIFNHFFDEELFPKLQLFEDYKSIMKADTVTKETVDDGGLVYDVISAEPFMSFVLNDNKNATDKQFITDTWLTLNKADGKSIIDGILFENDGFPSDVMIDKMTELKNLVTQAKESIGIEEMNTYPYITFLGTSSSTPSKYRNVSSILIEAYEDTNVLFDCGECSTDRILTLFGADKAKMIIQNLQMICITHNHLDHHSGLYGLLKYRRHIGNCKPCLLVTPKNVYNFTTAVENILNSDYCTYNCEWFHIDLMEMEHNNFSTGLSRTILDKYEKILDITITPVRVFHTNTSYGFILTGRKIKSDERWKITYSGDTTPRYEGLVREGMNSDMLIHEATMDDCLEEMAKRKRHSTVSQAIEEGIKMNAKFTMLTHFSSRYPLVPPYQCLHDNVGQAFDFMRVNFQTCQYLKILNVYFQYIFPSHWKLLVNERKRACDEKEKPISKKQKLCET